MIGKQFHFLHFLSGRVRSDPPKLSNPPKESSLTLILKIMSCLEIYRVPRTNGGICFMISISIKLNKNLQGIYFIWMVRSLALSGVQKNSVRCQGADILLNQNQIENKDCTAWSYVEACIWYGFIGCTCVCRTTHRNLSLFHQILFSIPAVLWNNENIHAGWFIMIEKKFKLHTLFTGMSRRHRARVG